MKKTKIVCTIGPASNKLETMEGLIKNGMNVARLNFSHGSYDDHFKVLQIVRRSSAKLKEPVAVLQDLQGPRFRVGMVGDGITLEPDSRAVLLYEKEFSKLLPATKTEYIPIRNSTLYQDLKSKDIILIDDGLIRLQVVEVAEKQIITKVIHGGLLKSNKGMNFPGVDLKTSSLTAKDKLDLRWGIDNKVDFVAFSFVRSAKDVKELRTLIKKLEDKRRECVTNCKKCEMHKLGTTCTKIIAKIETVQAIANFDEILALVDGIMVARGDLGIELPAEQVPLLQKKLIAKCNEAGKMVIVATQMLDSMVKNPIPTRAEVSDVANAILDGTDAVMLSAESAAGQHPISAVQVMSRVARDVEPTLIESRLSGYGVSMHSLEAVVEAVSLAVVQIARQVKADAIVCSTTTGFTPRLIARYKPSMPIIALTDIDKTRDQLSLSWGVEAHQISDSFGKTFDLFIKNSITFLKKKNKIKKGDKIIFAMDHPFDLIGETNLIKVEVVE